VIQKCRHADEHVGLDLADEAQVAVGAHRFPAAGAEHEAAKLRAAVVCDPECEMRREWKQIQHAHLALGATGFIDARATEFQIFHIVRGVKERDRIGAAARGAREQQWPKLALEALRDRRFPAQQRAHDCRGTPGQDSAIRLQRKVPDRIGAVRAGEEIALRGERDTAQVVGRAQLRRIESFASEERAVVRRKGQHGFAQVTAQPCELPVTLRARVGWESGVAVHEGACGRAS
jgi:hypothetical protein